MNFKKKSKVVNSVVVSLASKSNDEIATYMQERVQSLIENANKDELQARHGLDFSLINIKALDANVVKSLECLFEADWAIVVRPSCVQVFSGIHDGKHSLQKYLIPISFLRSILDEVKSEFICNPDDILYPPEFPETVQFPLISFSGTIQDLKCAVLFMTMLDFNSSEKYLMNWDTQEVTKPTKVESE